MNHYKKLLATLLIAVFAFTGSAGAASIGDINIHGFVSQGYIQSTRDQDFLIKDSHKGSFEFNELGLNFSTELVDNLSMGIQFAAFDMGDIGNDEVIVDWAQGDYSFRDYLGLRAGIMKIPFGLYNETRKIDMVRTSILLPTSIYPEWFRESFARLKGAGLYGTLPGNISYQAMFGDVDIQADGGLTDGLETLLADFLPMNTTATTTDYAYAGKMQWDSPFGLKLAACLYTLHELEVTMTATLPLEQVFIAGGQPEMAALGLTTPLTAVFHFEPIETYVLSAEYMADRLTLTAEYAEYDVEFDTDIAVAPALSAAIPPLRDKFTMQGYYGGASYRVLSKLEIGAYYSELYKDKDDHDGKEYVKNYPTKPDYNAWLKDICLSARYDISDNWCAKIEGHLLDGTYMAFDDTEKNWELYGAKLTYSF